MKGGAYGFAFGLAGTFLFWTGDITASMMTRSGGEGTKAPNSAMRVDVKSATQSIAPQLSPVKGEGEVTRPGVGTVV